MVYKMFDKKTSGGAAKDEIMSKQELAKESQKSIIRKLENTKVSSFKDNIWGDDLNNMQLISKFKFLSCIIDIYSKHAWIALLKTKKVLQLLMLFTRF